MPLRATSDGDEAADFAGAYGLTADPWQRLVLTGWLALGEDDRYACPRCGLTLPRQNGKNACLEIRELYGAALLGERILHTAHEVKTARKHFLRLLYFFDNRKKFPDLNDLVAPGGIRRTNGQEAVVLSNGGSIELAARSKGSARGFSVDVLVADEAQELTDDELEALLPTISASANPQLLLTGTPPKPNAITGEVFVRMRDEGLAGGGERLCWHEWGIETQALGEHPKGEHPVLDDPQVWAQANPALGIRLRSDTIADERAAMSDASFARERLGMWPKVTGPAVRLIPQDVWDLLADPQSEAQDPVCFAVDMNPLRTHAVIGMVGRRTDGRTHYEVVDRRDGSHWVVPRLVELRNRWRPAHVVLDPSGPAGSLVGALEEAGVTVTKVTGPEYAAACGLVYDEVLQGSARHLGQPELDDAVGNAAKRVIGNAWGWDRRDSAVDIAALVAVTLARHGHAKKPGPSVYEDRGLISL